MGFFSLITCYDDNRLIGIDGQLPWHLPEDMQRFVEITKNKTIAMGKATYDSIGHPLPDRLNIVLTSDKSFKAKGVQVVRSIDSLLNLKPFHGEIVVIGGARLYSDMLLFCNRMYLTRYNRAIDVPKNSKATYFPEWNPNEWRLARYDCTTRKDCEFIDFVRV